MPGYDASNGPRETKLQMLDVTKASSFLPLMLCSFICMPASGSSGGHLVAWDSNVIGTAELYKDRFCISVHFRLVSTNIRFTLTTVYAPCEDLERLAFFQTLDPAALAEGPWILLGDFNMYKFAHEKSRAVTIGL